MHDHLTAPACYDLRSLPATAQRVTRFRILDTHLGLLHLMPGDWIVRMGEITLGFTHRDFVCMFMPATSAAQHLAGASPLDLRDGTLPTPAITPLESWLAAKAGDDEPPPRRAA